VIGHAAPVVARVLPDVSGLDKFFDYLVPDDLRDQVRVGSIVRVPLVGRRIGAWVVGLTDVDGDGGAAVPLERLKSITRVTGFGLYESELRLAEWAARRWVGPLRAVLRSASPERAVRSIPSSLRHTRNTNAPSSDGERRPIVERLPPSADQLAPLLDAVHRGPTLAVTPSIHTAAVLAARVRAAGFSVALVPRDWAAAAGGADLVIGARAAVWAPCPAPSFVVVLDEHDDGLQEERSPTWHAREVAMERARRAGAHCVLVSPSPSMAALVAGGIDDRCDRSAVPTRVPSRVDERAGWPVLDIVDRSDDEPWKASLLSSRLIAALREHSRRVVCVYNVTGRARRLACRSCRSIAVCERCTAAVSERHAGELSCDRCGMVRPIVCQECGSGAFAVLRQGVSRLRDELEAAAGRSVVEVTGALDPDDQLADAGVYVGTEAVLHRVAHADIVAFIDFDAELLAPRYRAAEQAIGLLVRAARLLGPRNDGGRLLVQTREPRHPVLDAVLHADPARLVPGELQRRRELGFPPYAALATVTGSGVEDFAISLRQDRSVRVLGPVDGTLMVRADTWDELATALRRAERPPRSRLRVVVDPPRV
jgi:primosomal protein N' (replication factor Y) (superfamily II helicase)